MSLAKEAMLDALLEERVQSMTADELRWLDNVKKAFLESDDQLRCGKPEDRCLEELLKAIDTAKTLQRSLQGESISSLNNARKFIGLIYEEVPRPESGGLDLALVHARTGETKKYGFGELVYEIRCMIHENENLNIAEGANYHILLDWGLPEAEFTVTVENGNAVVNGHFLWARLRQILAKFITAVDALQTYRENR